MSTPASCPGCGAGYLLPNAGPCPACGSERHQESSSACASSSEARKGEARAIPRRIVAEVSKTWGIVTDRDPTVIAKRFELVVEANASRGFALESWRFQAYAVPRRDGEHGVVETIVAVFVEAGGA